VDEKVPSYSSLTSPPSLLRPFLSFLPSSLGAPPEEWRVEVAYKTVRGPRTGTGREAEQQQEAGVTGESLYVVKSSEAPGKVFMLVRREGGRKGGREGGEVVTAARSSSSSSDGSSSEKQKLTGESCV